MRGKQIFTDHCVIFIDFLGFRNILNNKGKMRDLLSLLQGLQAAKSNFQINKRTFNDLSGSIQLKAAISAFSDHVVISYTLDQMCVDERLNEHSVPYLVLDHAREFIAQVAGAAFTLGLLIRGGIAIGKLYHHDGVVFGKGLVEAYRLESEVAIYPRVVLSGTMSANGAWQTEKRLMVKKDFDGILYLDYLHPMIMSFAPSSVDWPRELGKRVEIIQDDIKTKIRKLKASGQLKEATKWGWFANQIAEAIRTLPQDGLSDHGLSREQLARLGLK